MKVSHLQKVLIVMAVVVILGLKNEQWWSSLFIVLYLYYFIFITNLFVKTHTTENVLTKLFFGLTEMPLILAGIMIFTIIVFIRKKYPEVNFDKAYINAVVGGIATTIGRYKRGKFIKRQV